MTNDELRQQWKEAGFILPKAYVAKKNVGNSGRKKPTQNEHNEQVKFFVWIAKQAEQDQRYRLCFAIPNGSQRNKITAFKLKQEGVKAGVPDIFFSYPTKKYHGLYIEMKYGKNKTSDKQNEFISLASIFNYKCEVCYSSEEAISCVINYLEEV